MDRRVLANADVLLLVLACAAGAGLFLVWAARGFTWTSHPEVAAKTVKRTPPVVPSRPTKPERKRHLPRSGVTLTLVATRGAAWVSLRAGSPSGRMVYEGLLPRRKKITVTGARFFGRFQASSNLVALLGGRRANLAPYELRDVLITKTGIRLLAAPRPANAPAVIAS